MKNLSGATAVITGAASGIGRGIALAVAEQGMNVVAADVDDEAGLHLVEELRGGGTQALYWHTDVRSLDEVKALAATVRATFGDTHLLCNNAGVVLGGAVAETAREEWEFVLSVNLWGVINGLLAFLPGMSRQQGERHIVNTSSMSALRVYPETAMYVASKFAVVGISDVLATERDQHGCGVSVLLPGPVRTQLNESERRWRGLAEAPDMTRFRPDIPLMDALDVGRMLVDAVRADQQYIVTHPEFLDRVRARHQAIEGAFARG